VHAIIAKKTKKPRLFIGIAYSAWANRTALRQKTQTRSRQKHGIIL